jgi:hypothetical protein
MSKLSDDLKRILNGLALQDAGEFLSLPSKMKALGIDHGPYNPQNSAHSVARFKTQRVALINDGRDHSAALEYAIDSCSRHGGKIDLLIHGTDQTAHTSKLETQLSAAGLDYQTIQLGTAPIDSILTYVSNQPALAFLVATPDDAVAKVLVEQVIPNNKRRLPLPLVLIQNRPSDHACKQSAA